MWLMRMKVAICCLVVYMVDVATTVSAASCDVNVPCSCCADDGLSCDTLVGNYCRGPCKEGYWGGRCINECPGVCMSCHQNFGKQKECFSCIDGRYGHNCSDICPQCMRCNKDRGDCTSCIDGQYGTSCQHSCSVNCLGQQCTVTSGQCNRCTDGYYGHYCNKTCNPNCHGNVCDMSYGVCYNCTKGMFGYQCNKTCPTGCNGSICQRSSGICTDGCIEHFIGDKCDKCQAGKYGTICEEKCPTNCLYGTCDRNNGTCTHGCTSGYSDSIFCCVNNSNCDLCPSQFECKECKEGTFGQRCEHSCPDNCKDTCVKDSGNCNRCKMNHYGPKCENTCPETCLITAILKSRCNTDNGNCEFGCRAGFYGNMCELHCSNHCNGSCNQQSGECHNCTYNRHGRFCEHECSLTCIKLNNTLTCNKETAKCLHGCSDGFFGDTCERSCSSGCKETACNNSTGHCTDGCTEGFSGPFCLADTDELSGQPTGDFPTTSIGIVVGACVAFVVMIVVIAVVIRKRCTNSETTDGKTSPKIKSPNKDSTEMVRLYENVDPDEADEDAFVPEIDHVEVTDEHIYYNNSSLKVRTEDLYRYLSKSDETYRNEFLMLPTGLIKPYNDAKSPINAQRNRYNMVYPYDDSRVKVNDGKSDYINASYIDGYKKKNAYIACLGPTAKILGDFGLFWKMIWQEKVETIVMLTKLKEGPTMKCDQYWPNAGKSGTYGNVMVQSTGEDEYAEFIVRNMTISMDNEKRQFHHIHFTAWPDKGVPSDVISIINLRNKVIGMRMKFDGPLVVHCSAGIGRTGTYIALDILIRRGQAEQCVDVLESVIQMRDQRVHMVQTVDQYKYLHHAVLWSLSIDTAPVQADRFMDLSWIYQDDGLTNMLKQLQMENWYDTEEEKKAVEAHKMIPSANRENADIPGGRHAVRVMMRDTKQQMKSDYINAVFIDIQMRQLLQELSRQGMHYLHVDCATSAVHCSDCKEILVHSEDGYRKQDRFIAAQTPLTETVPQFLDMVVQRRVGCIVDLDPQHDPGYYHEEGQELKIGGVVFKTNSRTVLSAYMKQDIQVVEKRKEQSSRVITHYQFTDWPQTRSVPDSNEFVKLIHEVENLIIKTADTGPILVHCMNGADRSALFCAMWLLIERIGIDHNVSVLNTLRQVKSRRRMAIPNKEQIEFCFKGVATHLNLLNENVYSNT